MILAGRDPARLADGPAETARAAGAGSVETAAFDALPTETHERFVDSWRPAGSLDELHAWSLSALGHIHSELDMPPLHDLPEHLDQSER